MSDLVGNLEGQFSRLVAHMVSTRLDGVTSPLAASLTMFQ